MPAYEEVQYSPPAPVAYVTLRNSLNGSAWENVPMLIDTGADVTLIPRNAIDQLGLETLASTQYQLEGFDGSTSLASVVQLEFIFLSLTFRGQFLFIDQEWGIIGRNILNAVAITLDGPALSWDEAKRK